MYQVLKRLVDIVLSATLLLLFAIPMLCVAGLILLLLGRPILFSQRRIGLGEREFLVWKFRSMREAYRPDGKPLSDPERMTRFGNFLRKASLDELPQLWNVLRGDMSLIGPRPLLVEYLPYYRPEERKRHTVRPGITGWAQVQGRNAASWDDRLAWDIYYVDHCSPALDLKIAWLTIGKVCGGSGVEFKQGAVEAVKLSSERSHVVPPVAKP